MIKYTFEEMKKMLLQCIKEHQCEAELRLFFENKPYEYMIIIYDDHCSFQRCGNKEEQSGEYSYATLDVLYRVRQIDDIILERDWKTIADIDCTDFDTFGIW